MCAFAIRKKIQLAVNLARGGADLDSRFNHYGFCFSWFLETTPGLCQYGFLKQALAEYVLAVDLFEIFFGFQMTSLTLLRHSSIKKIHLQSIA